MMAWCCGSSRRCSSGRSMGGSQRVWLMMAVLPAPCCLKPLPVPQPTHSHSASVVNV